MSAHAERATLFLLDQPRSAWHDQAVWWVRQKRDRAASALPEWEELRDQASRIKAHALSRLADYLEQFERNAVRLGARVHWRATPTNTTASCTASFRSTASPAW